MTELNQMMTTKEKASYCIGLQTGANIKQQFADVDLECIYRGFVDAFKNNTPQIPIEEINAMLESLRNQVEMQQKQFITKISEENKKASEVFLNGNKDKEGVVTLSSGLQYKVLSKGPGTSEHPTSLDSVKIHYRGTFTDGRVFDSSYQRGQPAVFPLSRVISGWSEGLQFMQVGDKFQLFIPPYLAYGEQGFGQDIAPNTALVFEVELLGINEVQ